MGAIVELVMVIGLMAGGAWFLINRCTIMPELCQSASAQPAAASTDTTTTTGTSVVDKKDNGKKKKCGCCSCVQNSTSLITCTLSNGDKLQFTGGHSLADQCSLCATDPNICANAKLNNKVPKQSAHDANMNKANAIPAGTTSEQKAKILGGTTTRPKGCDLPLCNLSSDGTPICTCPKSHYAVRRSYYADTSNYRAFRNRISFG